MISACIFYNTVLSEKTISIVTALIAKMQYLYTA